MSKKWTDESARAYVAKVQGGRSPMGLSYYSAVDYLTNHTTSKIEKNTEEVVFKKVKKKKNDTDSHL